MRSGQGVTVGGNWSPSLREPVDDVKSAWSKAAARTIDMIQNSGFISGIVDQAVANVVGTGLRLKSIPDTDALRISAKEASVLGRTIQRRFQRWAKRAIECDAESRKSFGHLQAVAYRHFLAFGEVLATVPWLKRAGGSYHTKVRLVLPTRLSQESNGNNLVQGVTVDNFGAALSYTFKAPDSSGISRDVVIPARDRTGRFVVIHTFDGMTGQVRGITPIAPVLRVTQQFDQLANATLTAAIVQAVFAATIESAEPTKELLDALQSSQEKAAGQSLPLNSYFEASNEWGKEAHIDLGVAGRFAHLFPGQKLNFHETKQSGANYEAFANYLMREIARCIGITAESATGDYRNATYSSIRMATADIGAVTKFRREHIIVPFCQNIFEAWLEEEIESGGIVVPGGIAAFTANRAAYARAEWNGPARPQADEAKTAKAFATLREMGVITDEAIAHAYDTDIEDVYEGRQREATMRAEYGLPDMLLPARIEKNEDEDDLKNVDADN